MEILLLQDIAGIGKKNDLLVVGDGFALNCLLPLRKALVATPTVRKRYAEQIRKRAEEKEREKQIHQAAATALAGKVIQLSRKAGKTGKLYAAISAEDISNALRDQHAANFPAESIQIAEPIKAIGSHSVQVKVGESMHSVTVVVTEQKDVAMAKAA